MDKVKEIHRKNDLDLNGRILTIRKAQISDASGIATVHIKNNAKTLMIDDKFKTILFKIDIRKTK